MREKWKNNEWQNAQRVYYNYNSNNNLVLYLSEIWDDNQWISIRRENYHYSESQKMTLFLIEEYWNDQWENVFYESYTFDSNDNLILYLSEEWLNDVWVPIIEGITISDSFNTIIDIDGSKIELFYKTITNVDEGYSGILEFSLAQNYPNPFNPSTTISYSIPEQSQVELKVFDVLGREVAMLVNKEQSAGSYKVEFDGSNLTSGIYFYRIQTGYFLQTKKMVLLK